MMKIKEYLGGDGGMFVIYAIMTISCLKKLIEPELFIATK
jgi:hypothetical protein